MKKTLLLAAVVTLLGTALSFAVARWMICRTQTQAAVRVHDAAWLKQELSLTDTQAREVERAEHEFQEQMNSFCATHCAARFALGDELAKPTVDAEQARASVEKMNGVQADAERTTLAHILKVRSLLNEQQAQRYASIVRDQVCNMPMGAP
jgi:conjugal transfer/entry exclusion protein